jgi:hypothetical protein
MESPSFHTAWARSGHGHIHVWELDAKESTCREGDPRTSRKSSLIAFYLWKDRPRQTPNPYFEFATELQFMLLRCFFSAALTPICFIS